MIRRVMGSSPFVLNLVRITSTQTLIAGSWHSLDLFLVGGGGSGAAGSIGVMAPVAEVLAENV